MSTKTVYPLPKRALSVLWFTFLIVLLSNMARIPFTKSVVCASLLSTNDSNPPNTDVNNDGAVDILDIGIVAVAWGSYPEDARWNPRTDLNDDGCVNVIDLVLVAQDFGYRSARTLARGVVVSDTAWMPWGSYFKDSQIEVLKELEATVVRIMLDRNAWDTNDVSNVFGIPYPDYIKKLVELCKPELKVILDLSRDSSRGMFSWSDKLEIVTTPELRSEWINWGKHVIAYCKPDAIGIMNEPTSQLDFDQYYSDFVIPSIEAYRSVDPNIKVLIMSAPYTHMKHFVQRSVVDMPHVYFEFHVYYSPVLSYREPYGWELAYASGALEEARSALYNWLAEQIDSIPEERVIFGECGVMIEEGEGVPSLPNWDVFLKDVYDYVKQEGLNGLLQYAFSKQNYLMLDPKTGYTTLTEYGEFWAENCP